MTINTHSLHAILAGNSGRLKIYGIPNGLYAVSLFEGRTTDVAQSGKVWTTTTPGEPATQNTGR